MIWVSSSNLTPSNYLVGGWPTPLKNDGVRQLGWWFHSQLFLEILIKFHGSSHHQPVIQIVQPLFLSDLLVQKKLFIRISTAGLAAALRRKQTLGTFTRNQKRKPTAFNFPPAKSYFTSRGPHHDIYTFYYWQIFWHSIWHFIWHSIWHTFWHSIWHIFWHSIWHIFWHSIWHIL